MANNERIKLLINEIKECSEIVKSFENKIGIWKSVANYLDLKKDKLDSELSSLSSVKQKILGNIEIFTYSSLKAIASKPVIENKLNNLLNCRNEFDLKIKLNASFADATNKLIRITECIEKEATLRTSVKLFREDTNKAVFSFLELRSDCQEIEVENEPVDYETLSGLVDFICEPMIS